MSAEMEALLDKYEKMAQGKWPLSKDRHEKAAPLFPQDRKAAILRAIASIRGDNVSAPSAVQLFSRLGFVAGSLWAAGWYTPEELEIDLE